jgi:hypothetical protein
MVPLLRFLFCRAGRTDAGACLFVCFVCVMIVVFECGAGGGDGAFCVAADSIKNAVVVVVVACGACRGGCWT